MESPKIIIPDNCGNSPKAKFLIEFNSAFVTNDISFIVNAVDDNIVWTMVGDSITEGKKSVEKALNQMQSSIEELEIENLITHGALASAEGRIKLTNGKIFAFCDTYQFVSAGKNIIKRLNSYVIEI